MARRPRRDVLIRRQANRVLRVFELRFARAVKRYQKETARQCRGLHTMASVTVVLQGRQAGLASLCLLWLKRIAHYFGRLTIDRIEVRRQRKKSWEVKNTFEIFSNEVLAYLNDEALDMATTITGDLTEEARAVLATAFEEGLGEEETAERLAGVIEMEDWRLERITRTESHTAANVGSDTAARTTGADLVKEWGATDDARTRASHAEADGQRREMDEPFEVGDAVLAFPGDPSGPPAEIINCRCVVLYHPRVNGQVLD